jgi:hypothetical protein
MVKLLALGVVLLGTLACERLEALSQALVAVQAGAPNVCRTNDDCTLLPSRMTCCGECAPAPPFEAVTRQEMDALLIELETTCAQSTRLCTPPVCEPPLRGCSAQARCSVGRCVVDETGCDKPVS